jgi:ATP-dependent Clp protease ATP-binding subunit ClpC
MFDRFTHRATLVILLAEEEAGKRGHTQINTEHLLLGVRRIAGSTGAEVLDDLGLDLPTLEALVSAAAPNEVGACPAEGQIPFGNGTKKALEGALRVALGRKDEFVGTEHLLLGIYGRPKCNLGFQSDGTIGHQILASRLGVSETLESRVRIVRSQRNAARLL